MSRRLFPLALPLFVLWGCTDSPTSPVEVEEPSYDWILRLRGNDDDVAIIGDAPSGEKQLSRFPDLIDHINRDESVGRVVHLGDFLGNHDVCSNEWFRTIRDDFNTFADPLIYTPGDNEWADCHGVDNGNYNPLERLATIRRLFFRVPYLTLGSHPALVTYQIGHPENRLWSRSGVTFATVHVVGSDNDLDEWTCFYPFTEDPDLCPYGGSSPETPEMTEARLAELAARTEANVRWLRRAFFRARLTGAAGVVLFMQADMFSPGKYTRGFEGVVLELARLAAEFKKPVLLFNGDTHTYLVRQPLVYPQPDGNLTPGKYGAAVAPNVTQIVIKASTEADGSVWVRLKIDPRSDAVFTWEQVFVP